MLNNACSACFFTEPQEHRGTGPVISNHRWSFYNHSIRHLAHQRDTGSTRMLLDPLLKDLCCCHYTTFNLNNEVFQKFLGAYIYFSDSEKKEKTTRKFHL